MRESSFQANGYSYQVLRSMASGKGQPQLADKKTWEGACEQAHRDNDLMLLADLHGGVIKIDDKSGLSQECGYEDMVAGTFYRGAVISIDAYVTSRSLLVNADLITPAQSASLDTLLDRVDRDSRLTASGISKLDDEIRFWVKHPTTAEEEPIFVFSGDGNVQHYDPQPVAHFSQTTQTSGRQLPGLSN